MNFTKPILIHTDPQTFIERGQNCHPLIVQSSQSLIGQKQLNTGKWNRQEIQIFNRWYSLVDDNQKKWEILAQKIKTRTPAQVRSHTQKFFEKVDRDKNRIGSRPQDLELVKENQTVRKTRAAVGKMKKISKQSNQERDCPIRKHPTYIIVAPPMRYHGLEKEEMESQVKIAQESNVSFGADQENNQGTRNSKYGENTRS